ncbi:uncharacterized protein LOC143290271 isoform X2 [Babylonia areolata]|uniref:uncharacterized protein LOC143290271 isoform X2 n=1 Tax=Babylonia areolata TaxID=304850 RepID=UPI003FD0CE21
MMPLLSLNLLLLLCWECQASTSPHHHHHPDTLASRSLEPELTHAVTFPATSRSSPRMRSLVSLPDGSLLLGDLSGGVPITRVLLTAADPATRVTSLPLPGRPLFKDVKSLAAVDERHVLTTGTGMNHDVLKLLTLGPDMAEVAQVQEVRVPERRTYSDHLIVAAAAGSEPGTFLLSGQDIMSHKSFVDVITADGQFVDTLADNMDFVITGMTPKGDLVYLSGNYPQQTHSTIVKLNRVSKTTVGDAVDFSAVSHRANVYQADVDGEGNVYVAVYNPLGCFQGQGQCCRCVMLITPEGDRRVLLNYGFQERNLEAVLVTSSGFVTSSVVKVPSARGKSIVVEEFDLV